MLSSTMLSATMLGAGEEEVSISIDLAGDALAEASASGTLYPTYLTAAATSVASAAGNLALTLPLSAAGEVSAHASGYPDVLAALGGAASALASASAAISATLRLAGGGTGEAVGSATLGLQTGLAGAASDTTVSSGLLGILTSLAGSAAAIAAAVGVLDQRVAVAGAAEVLASAAGGLTQALALASLVEARVAATGGLTLTQSVAGGVTYAVNVTTGAVTTFENFDFERLVYAHGRTYGLKLGVLYRIGGVEDPDATEIPVTLRFGASDLGGETLQRLDKVYVRSRERAGITLTPIYDEVVGRTYYPRAGVRDGLIKHRASVGLNNRWHTLGLRLTNLNGGAIDIGGFEFLTAPLSSRIP